MLKLKIVFIQVIGISSCYDIEHIEALNAFFSNEKVCQILVIVDLLAALSFGQELTTGTMNVQTQLCHYFLIKEMSRLLRN